MCAGVAVKGGQVLDADLVVDASGKLSRVQGWLTDGGYETPRSVEVNPRIGYAGVLCSVPEEVLSVCTRYCTSCAAYRRGIVRLHHVLPGCSSMLTNLWFHLQAAVCSLDINCKHCASVLNDRHCNHSNVYHGQGSVATTNVAAAGGQKAGLEVPVCAAGGAGHARRGRHAHRRRSHAGEALNNRCCPRSGVSALHWVHFALQCCKLVHTNFLRVVLARQNPFPPPQLCAPMQIGGIGYGGDHPPGDMPGLLAFLDSLQVPELTNVRILSCPSEQVGSWQMMH